MKTPARVVAVAGRRIDAANVEMARFPRSSEAEVYADILRLFEERGVNAVVASAACGADILALEAAAELGLPTRIVLPFDRARFRETSVIDRGADWGPRYDAVLAAADARGDVIVLDPGPGGDDDAYSRATQCILDEALAKARVEGTRAIALAIWDEQPREGTDATKEFIERSSASAMEVISLRTLR